VVVGSIDIFRISLVWVPTGLLVPTTARPSHRPYNHRKYESQLSTSRESNLALIVWSAVHQLHLGQAVEVRAGFSNVGTLKGLVRSAANVERVSSTEETVEPR